MARNLTPSPLSREERGSQNVLQRHLRSPMVPPSLFGEGGRGRGHAASSATTSPKPVSQYDAGDAEDAIGFVNAFQRVVRNWAVEREDH